MFIAFLLQFDAERALQNGKRDTSTNIKKGKKKEDDDDEDDDDATLSITGNFSKPYFNASLFVYMLGLILTLL